MSFVLGISNQLGLDYLTCKEATRIVFVVGSVDFSKRESREYAGKLIVGTKRDEAEGKSDFGVLLLYSTPELLLAAH